MMVIPETRRPHLIIYLHFHFTSIFRHLKMVIYNRKNEIELNKLFHIKYQNKIGTSLSFILLLYRWQDCYRTLLYELHDRCIVSPSLSWWGPRCSFTLGGGGVFAVCVFFFYIWFVSALCLISNVACVSRFSIRDCPIIFLCRFNWIKSRKFPQKLNSFNSRSTHPN